LDIHEEKIVLQLINIAIKFRGSAAHMSFEPHAGAA
jgi:hypothetical protein